MSEVVNGYFDSNGAAINAEASLGLLPSGTGRFRRQSHQLQTNPFAIASGKRVLMRASSTPSLAQRDATLSRSDLWMGGEYRPL